MLARLVGKLLIKACIPLVMVAGVMSYGVHLRGGDPAALWRHVAGGAFDQAGAMFTKAKNDAAGVAGNLARSANNSSLSGEDAGHTQVFKWVDDAGVTHFSSAAPAGIDASSISVDPNTNILAPVVTPVVVHDEGSPGEHGTSSGRALQAASPDHRQGNGSAGSGVSQAVRRHESQTGEPLPGIAGHLLSGGAAGENGLDAAQLIRLLQSGNQ